MQTLFFNNNTNYQAWISSLGMAICFGVLMSSANCKTPEAKPQPEKADFTEKQEKPLPSPELLAKKLERIESAKHVVYYELPDMTMETDPEELLTFDKIIRDKSQISRVKEIISRNPENYSVESNGYCRPVYSSALVFRNGSDKEVVLFSLKCGVLKLSQTNAYLNVSRDKMELESIFREMRR